MRFIIEGQEYDVEKLQELLGAEYNRLKTDSKRFRNKATVGWVGYLFNPSPKIHDFVFILPKAFCTSKATVFGVHFNDLTEPSALQQFKGKEQKIFDFTVYLYKALERYQKRTPKSEIINDTSDVKHVKLEKENTSYLKIIQELIRFHRENQGFIISFIGSCHNGNNKIDWKRTISHTQALISKDSYKYGIIYPGPITKKRLIDYDDELMIIFYSILHYLRMYGFKIFSPVNYDILKGKQFETLLKGRGRARLLEIKHKYFSDLAVELWHLCYDFFICFEKVSDCSQQEKLLAHNFERIFEDMVDSILGDNKLKSLYQDSSKEKRFFDHIAIYKDIIFPDNKLIFYISDSKYYSHNSPIPVDSITKQFGYARSLVQSIISRKLFDNDKQNHYDLLRDSNTEGYYIVPNFFIRAIVDENMNDGIKLLRSHKNLIEEHNDLYELVLDKKNNQKGFSGFIKMKQWNNRLFDRDTRFIAVYATDFYTLVALYAEGNLTRQKAWREKVYNRVFQDFKLFINNHYEEFKATSINSNGKIISWNNSIKLFSEK